jgi:hypothetical protein
MVPEVAPRRDEKAGTSTLAVLLRADAGKITFQSTSIA